MGYLRNVPTMEWNLDVQRFFDHIRWDTIAFSGKNFFLITRGAILTVRDELQGLVSLIFLQMVGFIITYEMLLANESDQLLVNMAELCKFEG